jgi:hypothetical protein
MIVFWEDVQQYKHIQDDDERETIARIIYEKYIVKGSSLELNINKSKAIPVAEALEECKSGSKIPHDVFDQLEIHCVTDMRDVFYRFVASKEGAQIRKANQMEIAELRIMEGSGMIETRSQKNELEQPLL